MEDGRARRGLRGLDRNRRGGRDSRVLSNQWRGRDGLLEIVLGHRDRRWRSHERRALQRLHGPRGQQGLQLPKYSEKRECQHAARQGDSARYDEHATAFGLNAGITEPNADGPHQCEQCA